MPPFASASAKAKPLCSNLSSPGLFVKTVPQLTPQQAAKLVPENAVLMAGGFGMTGNPVHLLHALAETGTKGLTYIGNNVGEPDLGGGRLLNNGQIRKAIGSFFTSNRDIVKAAHSGEVEVQLIPQGTLAEAIRAGGAGIGGFYTPTAAGTELGDASEAREFDGCKQVFVPAIRANVAFVRAWKSDTSGNLVYRMTEQNFNRAMATAADLVIAEVESIVPAGEIPPESIHTPGCHVDYIVEAHTTAEELGSSASVSGSARKADPSRLAMAERALAELKEGDVVNLGIGVPTLVADLLTPKHRVILHTENGMLGVGPSPDNDQGAMDFPVNAGKIPVTALAGASYFDSADSFAMIRGGHIDVAIMGGLEVDAHGNLANWTVPGKSLLGVGGAMDLASGAKKLIILMLHTDRDGVSKVVPDCQLPITAQAAVDLLITNLAVFDFPDGKMRLLELMPGATIDQVRQATTAPFITA